MDFGFFRKHKEILSLLVLAAIFFVVYLFLYWDIFRVGFNPAAARLPMRQGEPPQLIFNQPDESVNYFFIKQLVLENRFSFPESLSDLALSQVHPRSTTVINGGIVPIGFPGFIVLLSLILKILTLVSGAAGFNLLAVMITPLVGVITPFFFYGFLLRLMKMSRQQPAEFAGAPAPQRSGGEAADREAGRYSALPWLSAVLMFILPPWWYYASRPFQHNVLFVCFSVLVLYCFSIFWERREQKNKIGAAFALGLFFGLAVYVRPSEMIWLAIVLAGALVLSRRYWHGREYLALAGALVLMAILFFTTQTAFYGHPLASGYVRPDISGAGGLITSGPQGIPILKAIFLPFGFHPRVIWHNLRGNFAELFGFWSFLMLAGLVYWIIDAIKTRRLNIRYPNIQYLVGCLFVSIYLLIFYGSWLFYDNLNQQFSIGSSHVRYFLLIYVLSLPLVAGFMLWLWRRGPIVKSAVLILFLVMATTAYLNVFAQFEGLSTVKNTVKAYQIWQDRVYSLTEKDAVILTHYADKYIFPGRKVVVGWDNPERKQAVVNLLKAGYKVYYYDFKLTEEMARQFNNIGLVSEPVLVSWSDLELRQLTVIR